MTTYKQLQREFDNKVKELQKNCKHKNLSVWAEIWWAPGHGTNNYVKVCKKCNERVMENYVANKCTKCNHLQSRWYGTCEKCKSNDMFNVKILEKLGKVIKEEKVKE